MKVVIPQMSATIVWFAVILYSCSYFDKSCWMWLSARLCKYSGRESLQIGVGMISRGEVALIVASKGEALDLMRRAADGTGRYRCYYYDNCCTDSFETGVPR